jgi:uncharacterized protein with HEPN domain
MDAVERCLQPISEAAIRFGADGPLLAPGIPWQDIRGIGNRLRHAYELVEPRILWNVVERHLPPLRAACERSLKALGDEGDGPDG